MQPDEQTEQPGRTTDRQKDKQSSRHGIRCTDRQICIQICRISSNQTSRYAECKTGRYSAARTNSCADMATDSQIDYQAARYAGKMTARCSSSSAGIRTTGRYAFRQATDARPPDQVGRTKWQNRLADRCRCKQMQMNAQPSNQICCRTDELPDCQNLQTNRCTDCSRTSNQIARCIARCIARQAEQRAGRPAEQMDIQTDRCTARNVDEHAEQMHEQQKKLNPIEDFTGSARNVSNAVSVKNPWHR
jgi:hypothetical protein